ncbi:putative ankyrin repeat protein [Cotonvirus japonicus]|uniref:Ankyrin repeat protein n=1 Tax=Cotonvirus japonicus TaxID=2811091 RepID=A0ABM7NTJ0_9VIRU|nr:putative ankyrin repeat protein [Cotonvirus japonicus]BCS83387.1 putative ankyrin repeat protein [Cotonvirus japonicus]
MYCIINGSYSKIDKIKLHDLNKVLTDLNYLTPRKNSFIAKIYDDKGKDKSIFKHSEHYFEKKYPLDEITTYEFLVENNAICDNVCIRNLLSWAFEIEYIELIQYLYYQNINFNIENYDVMYWAFRKFNHDIIKFLINVGFDYDYYNVSHIINYNDDKNLETIIILLEHKNYDINFMTKMMNSFRFKSEFFFKTITLFIKLGAHINYNNYNIIKFCFDYIKINDIDILFQYINVTDLFDDKIACENIIRSACISECDNIEKIKYLFNIGMNVNHYMNIDMIKNFISCNYFNFAEILKILIGNGLEYHQYVNDWCTLACGSGNFRFFEYMMDLGADVNYNNNIMLTEIIDYENYAYINHDYWFNYNVGNNTLIIIKSLIQQGMDINAHSKSFVLDVINYNNVKFLKNLIELGVDVTVDNNILIYKAVKRGYFSIAKLLKNSGAEFVVENEEKLENILKNFGNKYANSTNTNHKEIIDKLIFDGLDISEIKNT